MNFAEIVKASFILFAMIDVVGTMPYILLVRKKEGGLLPGKATLVAGSIMFFFLLTGEWLLNILGLTIHSFALAGSVIILASGIELVFGKSLYAEENVIKGVSSIVPIAFPMLTGAGTITTIISMKSEISMWSLSLAIILNLIIIYLALRSTGYIEKRLSPVSFILIRKFFGILVLAIGIQMLYTHILHLA